MAHNLPPVSKLITDSWHSYKPRFKELALLMVAASGISGIAMLVLITAFALIFISPVKDVFNYFKNSAGAFPITSFSLLIVALIIIIALTAIIQSWILASMWIATDNPKTIRISTALTAGWKRVWSFLGMSVIRGIICFLGTIFFFIPGILFSVWFIYSDILSVRGDKPLAALKNSRALVMKRWWITALDLLVAWLIIFLPYEAVSIIVQTFLSRWPENGFVLFFSSLIGIITLVVYIFFACPWFLVFKKTLLDAAQNNVCSPDQAT